MDRLLSPADAARLLGVTPATIRAMARRGTLTPVARTEGGIRLFSRKDVEELHRRRLQNART